MRRLPPLKLRTKLALSYALLFTVLLGITGVGVYRLMAFRLRADADDNLVDHLAGIWGYIHFQDGKPRIEYDPNNEYLAYFLHEATRYYQVYDISTGALLLESQDSALLNLALQPEDVQHLAFHPGIDSVTKSGVSLRFRSAIFHNNGQNYLLRVGVSIERDLADIAELRTTLLFLLPMMAAATLLGAWWMSSRALRPVRELQQEARAISINRLDRRLPRRGTEDELDALADTFNNVISRLDAGVQQMRRFAGYMAHELRTPMTVLRGETELELTRTDLPEGWRTHLENHLEEFDKLRRLIDRFLLLAKAETGAVQLKKQTLPLATAICSIAADVTQLAEANNIGLVIETDPEVVVQADREWIERAVINLVDNALKFTPKGGRITLSVRRDANAAILELTDTGRGINPEDLPHIFDYFYRSAEAPSHSAEVGGLGLALTKWVVEQHGGTIRVKSTVNRGTTFTISLPLET